MADESGAKKTAGIPPSSMIELGVNTGLIIVITVALLVIHRYTLGRFQGKEES